MVRQREADTSQNIPTQFRARREGPEALIQDVVVENIPRLLKPTKDSWTAASLPLGAGIPDLVVVSYEPQVFALANVELEDAEILAYLRAVGKASLNTIAQRMGGSPSSLSRRLYNLVEAEAVVSCSNLFSLMPVWRKILPEIVTIEIKVANWQRAIEQAARNRIFAHMSFVALPERVSQRVRTEPIFRTLGIGLISVADDDNAVIVRKPRRKRPAVWTYYYQLASILARNRVN
jgi:DNA-binding Lrp family transcriptional regulator